VVTREFDEAGERCTACLSHPRRAGLWRDRQRPEHSTRSLRIEITTAARAMGVARTSL